MILQCNGFHKTILISKIIKAFIFNDSYVICSYKQNYTKHASATQVRSPPGKADERVTLLLMNQYVQPTDRVLYIHSKGVSDARCTLGVRTLGLQGEGLRVKGRVNGQGSVHGHA